MKIKKFLMWFMENYTYGSHNVGTGVACVLFA